MLYDLHLFQRVYDFLLWIKPTVQRFTKVHKYSLGVQLENEVIELLKEIIRANFQKASTFLVIGFLKNIVYYEKALSEDLLKEQNFIKKDWLRGR